MKLITRIVSNVVSIALFTIWILMSYNIIEPNDKYISIGIVLSILFTVVSLKYMSYEDIESKERNVYQNVIGLFSLSFITLSILQQIVFGWYVLAYYTISIFIVYVAKESKKKQIEGKIA